VVQKNSDLRGKILALELSYSFFSCDRRGSLCLRARVLSWCNAGRRGRRGHGRCGRRSVRSSVGAMQGHPAHLSAGRARLDPTRPDILPSSLGNSTEIEGQTAFADRKKKKNLQQQCLRQQISFCCRKKGVL